MSDKIPFFINSNIVTNKNEVKDLKIFMNTVGGNVGNSYITYSLIKECFSDIKTLHHIPNINSYNFENSEKDIDFINNQATHVVFIMQDQIRSEKQRPLKLRYEKIMNFIKKLNKPVIIAGLGANYFTPYNKDFYKELSPELVQFLRFLSEHCIEIGVRGYVTQEILQNLSINNVRVIGCPSYFEQGRDRIITKHESISYEDIVLTSNFGRKIFMQNFQLMQDSMSKRFINACAYNIFAKDLTTFELDKLKNKKYYIFSNIQKWQNFIKEFKFAIGYRLHGAILSINSGVPAICGNGDARATEMCSFLGIPHIPHMSEDLDFLRLYQELDIDKINNSYGSLYENFEQFLNTNNLQLFENDNVLREKKNELLDFPTPELYTNGYDLKLYFYIIKKKIKDNIISKILNLCKVVFKVLKFKIITFS